MKALKCPNFNLIIWKREVGKIIFSRLRCKSWTCTFCAKANRELWRSHLRKRIGRIGGQWWFITITAAEWYREQAKSLANLRQGLDRLFKRIRRVWGKIEYVRVYEVHKDGVFHAHLIMSGLSNRVDIRCACGKKRGKHAGENCRVQTWAVRTWFKKNARACKMGYMVEVSQMHGIPKVVNYICKYITKEAQSFDFRGLRRIQTSQGIGAANARGVGKGWQVANHVYAGEANHAPLYDIQLKMEIPATYWLNNIVYPPEP